LQYCEVLDYLKRLAQFLQYLESMSFIVPQLPHLICELLAIRGFGAKHEIGTPINEEALLFASSESKIAHYSVGYL